VTSSKRTVATPLEALGYADWKARCIINIPPAFGRGRGKLLQTRLAWRKRASSSTHWQNIKLTELEVDTN
jgi:hypothetical protein